MRRPQLDGLRALAFLAVFMAHTTGPSVAGALGVRCFFALSGFLICGILLDGQTLREFYWRRALRILPLYYVALALLSLRLGMPGPWPHLSWEAAYLSNFAQYISRRHDSHFWTLAIEEQFYFVFPLLLAVFRRRPGLAIALGLVASKCCRIWLHLAGDTTNNTNWLPQVSAETLLWGALAALVMRRAAVAASRWRAPALWLGAALVAAWTPTLYANWMNQGGTFSYCLDGTPDGIGFAAVVLGLWLAPESSLARRALSWRPLAGTGAISYSLYLFHAPVLNGFGWPWAFVNAIAPQLPHGVALWVFYLPVTYALALLSSRYVEQPALRLRDFKGVRIRVYGRRERTA